MNADTDRLRAAFAGQYTIERELGRGGMATVYLAEDLKHHRPVAIKVLKPELAAVLGADRFVAEIATTAQLQHPHILPLFDSGQADGLLYYVMPYVEGETLRAKLDRETQLGIDDAVRIATDVADALDYAHRHGVIHRDIKPENILLRDGRPVVADFGIALAVSAAAGGRMTETGLSLGTPHYMSPEQATADKNITNRSDIYSLGAVLYEMLSGNPPHVGASAQQIIMKIVTEDVAPVTRSRKSVPLNVAAAVAKALEKLPADRFESANAFAEALVNPAFGARVAPEDRTLDVAMRPTLRSWLRSPWSWTLAGLALAGVFATAILASRGERQVPVFTVKTFGASAVFNARFAPDGETLVYSAAGDTGTVSHLYVIHPENPDAEAFGADSTHLLSVSRSGQLAVLTHARWRSFRLFDGTLATMAIGAPAAREIATHVREADWGPDGQSLAVIRDSGAVDRLEYPVGRVIAQWPGYLSDVRVSPSGDAVAFFEHPARYDDRGTLVVVDRDGRVLGRSVEYWGIEGLAWRADGRHLLYSASPVSTLGYSVYEADRAGHSRPVLTSAGGATFLDVSPKGRLAITSDQNSFVIFGRRAGATEETNLGVREFSDVPILTGDGRLLAFGDEGVAGGLTYSVMVRRLDGSPVVRVGEGSPVGISNDGRFVVSVVPTSPNRLMLYPVGPGETRRLDHGEFSSFDYSPSANTLFDGDRRFFICGTEPKHRLRCYVGDVGTGRMTPVTPEGSTAGVLSPNGEQVAAWFAGSVWLFSTVGAPPRVTRGMESSDQLIRWSPDGVDLWVFHGNATAIVRVDRVNPITGARSLLTEWRPRDLTAARSTAFVTLSDDSRAYAYVQMRVKSTLYTVDGVR